MYLDGGFEPAQAFVMKFILNDLEDKRIFYDSKTVLQEMVQEGGNHPVEYRLLKEEGPDPVSYTHLDVYKRQPLRCHQ